MKTFLLYPDFVKSAQSLDYRRLGKQRVECSQLLRGQWSNHPVAKMWLGYEYQLAEYGDEKFHQAHRSNLLTKDFVFYKNKFPNDKHGLSYIWLN